MLPLGDNSKLKHGYPMIPSGIPSITPPCLANKDKYSSKFD